jgi:hypothetical protein
MLEMAYALRSTLILFLFFISINTQAQVLISLLFGEALNSDKIEFGLTGGLNRSDFIGVPEAEGLNNFNLGFYFHLTLNPNSFISTGVLVKNNVGATGMPTYAKGDPAFDELFGEGILTTKINYFYVPIMWQQRIHSRWLVEAGVQPGLRSRAFDIFNTESNGGDLEFKKDVRNEYFRLDFGMVGGLGYKLNKDLKSMSVGFLYYQGLVDVKIADAQNVQNSSLNIYVRIPIGAGNEDKNQ